MVVGVMRVLNSVINNCHNETVIYLDNSDKDSSIHTPEKNSQAIKTIDDLRLSDNFLRNWSLDNDRYILADRNFSPTHLFVEEGTFGIPRTKEMKQQLSKFIL